jgi:hypothetical protein
MSGIGVGDRKNEHTGTPISFYIGSCTSPNIPINIRADPESRGGIIFSTVSIKRTNLQRRLDILFVIETTNLREPVTHEGLFHSGDLIDEFKAFRS